MAHCGETISRPGALRLAWNRILSGLANRWDLHVQRRSLAKALAELERLNDPRLYKDIGVTPEMLRRRLDSLK